MGKLKNINRNNTIKQIIKKTNVLSSTNPSAEACGTSVFKKQN